MVATTLQVWDGTVLKDASVAGVWSGSAIVPCDSWGIMPFGYLSVNDMLLASPFEVAHRGGSAQWPEMSMLAYTQSVAHGMKALEFSVARTSDTVLFGLHDTTLDRTSLNATGGVNARDLTWVQIQSQYKIDYLAGYSEPYLKLTDFLDKYLSSHVLFIDPKSLYGTYIDEMYSILLSYPNATDRIVIKQWGTATDYADEAREYGFKSWGYFYEADLENIGADQSHWDFLGMDYHASQDTFNFLLQYNKPVLAHIIPTVATRDTALTRLAPVKANGLPIGLMESGVKIIHPESV